MATLTIRDLDDQLVERLKEFTREATASKALVAAARMALDLARELDAERKLVEKWYTRAHVQQHTLEQLLPLCTQVAELAGQGDMFEAS